ncbi:MAG: class I SAM-dependent methyltransferase [Clostridiales bacterium]|nr:class I SAM-dependent methyltransferase [Clostridiales bacterium]
MSDTCRRPGGLEFTKELIRMAGLSPCRILDMGSGSGASLRLLESLGFEAVGVDKKESAHSVCGDIRALDFPSESFDAVLSECSFFISGDFEAALKEASRVLRPGGKLLLADVFFKTAAELKHIFRKNGLEILSLHDKTPAWKEYLIHSIWENDEDYSEYCSDKFEGYYLICAERV